MDLGFDHSLEHKEIYSHKGDRERMSVLNGPWGGWLRWLGRR